jgi:hypothetical protein
LRVTGHVALEFGSNAGEGKQGPEKALSNRECFLNKPYSIGGGRKDHVP